VQNNLTTLTNAKSWAGVTTSSDDVLLTRLIGSASRLILSYLQRPTLFQNVFSDVYDGVGNTRQILRNFPVISVTSVTIDFQTISQYQIPQQPSPYQQCGTGWVLEPWDGYPPGRPQAVDLRGFHFCRGHSNVQIVYTSGFVIQNEAQTVPSSGSYAVAVNAPNGNWGADQGVTYANGTALTPVASSPAQGQYAVSNGTYTFNLADAGQAVLISYSYIPSDIEDACINMVGERYNYKNRIGTVSKSLGGQETVSFSQKDMPDFIRTMLQPYRRVLPI
jgi:hypothetical protein